MYDTIAAIATPAGTSALGIIRMSGPDTFKIADKVFKSKNNILLSAADTHTIHFGSLIDGEGKTIDECLALVFNSPNSFTGEDSVEFSCHGNPLILRDALAALLQNGARLAAAGEFTKRAFLNGKLDLTQAEGIIELICAQGKREADMAMSHLKGNVGSKIESIRERLLNVSAALMAYIDFPDEDLSDVSNDTLLSEINAALQSCDMLIKTYDIGKVLKEGIKCAIVGKSNVGKSSLMNLLAGYEKSIVTDIPGTTRDILEETVILDGVKLNIYDTAGIRGTHDLIEKIGIEKTKEKMKDIELAICVFDQSAPLDGQDFEIMELTKDIERIAVLNKSDLNKKLNIEYINIEYKHIVELSSLTGVGFESFRDMLSDMFLNKDMLNNQNEIISTARQKDCLVKAAKSLERAKSSLEKGLTPDVAELDINEVISALGEITGQSVNEEIINKIFENFCVGK